MSGGTVCPECHSRVAVRLVAGAWCPQCESSKAWERYGRAGQKLVIGRRDIAESERRVQGDERTIGATVKHWLPGLIGLAAGAAGGWFSWDLFGARPLGPLEPLLAELVHTARWTASLGLVALALGVASTIAQKKGDRFRSVPLLMVNLSAVLVGAAITLAGAANWGLAGAFSWEHLAMPPLADSFKTIPAMADEMLSAQDRSILSATTVLVAPDRNGDARGLSLGSGAVIRSDDHTAFVVTCSHVAMPYASVAAFRDPKDAHPVWVYFSDGRHAPGTVVWTAEPPLDVALVRIEIDHPPAPVPVRTNADAAESGFTVSFVPNPFRSGWTIHRGEVLKREAHRTPAGEYSLIYTSLPVQPGDSGTGLFDGLGQLIGLNTWTQYEEGGPKGISLPSNTMERIVKMMDDNELVLDGGDP